MTEADWHFSDVPYAPLPAGDRITLTLLHDSHLHSAPLGDALPLDTLPGARSTMVPVDIADPAASAPGGRQAVLNPSSGRTCRPFEDVTIMAGYVSGQLHVQTRVNTAVALTDGSTTNSRWVYLMPTRLTAPPAHQGHCGGNSCSHRHLRTV